MTDAPGSKEFEALLEFLRDSRGFDFTGYKRASLIRRIGKRMSDIGIEGIPDYRAHLEAEPDEFAHLFNTILINVTSFFRDDDAWEYVRRKLLPKIVGRKGSIDPIRLWSAGCASGEEAFSLAMLFAEELGPEAFRARVKIYATDVDEEALAQARLASYSEAAMEKVPAELRARYFERSGTRWTFRPEYRRSVIFGRHDLVQDAPISRMDLITCRNVLMYFNADTQRRIASNLQFALKHSGYLVLGRAEMMLSHSAQFETVDLGSRIFRRKPTADRRIFAPTPDDHGSEPATAFPGSTVLERSPHAQVLLDRDGRVALINERARALFALTADDQGRPFKDLEFSYRPFELRSRVEDAVNGAKTVKLDGLQRTRDDGSIQHFDVTIVPLQDADRVIGTLLHVEDVTRFARLQAEHLRANQELETAYEELQSTNEELETTNEELQSTVEELETTNEELQSTNEELETMNEELQSTNAELQAINTEFHRADSELRALNAFMGAVLTSIHTGLVVVNEKLEILTWNQQAEELWGVRIEEVRGRKLLDLDIGLPCAELRKPIVACLTGSEEEKISVTAINRKGKTIRCTLTCTPLITEQGPTQEVVVLMETEEPKDG